MSNIEWTQETWNPVVGCTRVSAGCDHCYAVGMTHRLGAMAEKEIEAGRDPGKKGAYVGLTVLNGRGERHFNGVVRCVEGALDIPLKRKKPTTWFVNSMGDLFHRDVPFEFIDRVFAVMALTPQHTYQILTKRPERMAEYFNAIVEDDDGTMSRREALIGDAQAAMGHERTYIGPLPNVWLGTSCEDQAAADERIPHLLRCPASVRFLSCEPLLGGIDLRPAFLANKIMCPRCMPPGDPRCPYCDGIYAVGQGIDWVIAGGESGSGARPCDVAWIRSIVAQCKGAGVPVFVKQLGTRPGITVNEVNGNRFMENTYTRDCGFWPGCGYGKANGWIVAMKDKKGGEMSEWPGDLRVRETPTASKTRHLPR